MSFLLKNDARQNCRTCSFCGGFKIASFGHRQSEFHQKNVSKKLKTIAFHIIEKKTKIIKVHDIDWPNKDGKRFCHFCNDSYLEHSASEDFMIESLGAMYHHCSSPHLQAVKRFLKENKRKENFEKYVYSNEDLNGFLENVSEAKKRYLQKMDIINAMVVNQIKDVECERKELLSHKVVSSECTVNISQTRNEESALLQRNSRRVPYQPQVEAKIPPWLIEEKLDETDSPFDSTQSSSKSSVEPSMDTILKHIQKEKKKGLPDKRIKANIKNLAIKNSKWKPVFHGIWNKSRHFAQRKQKLSALSHQQLRDKNLSKKK